MDRIEGKDAGVTHEADNNVGWRKYITSTPGVIGGKPGVSGTRIPSGGSQCFPFYIYNEDGTNRRENITDWALEKFREQYGDSSITKWDIFHYVYGVLHYPVYRERYAANLKRELPRISLPPPATSVPLWMLARD